MNRSVHAIHRTRGLRCVSYVIIIRKRPSAASKFVQRRPRKPPDGANCDIILNRGTIYFLCDIIFYVIYGDAKLTFFSAGSIIHRRRPKPMRWCTPTAVDARHNNHCYSSSSSSVLLGMFNTAGQQVSRYPLSPLTRIYVVLCVRLI